MVNGYVPLNVDSISINSYWLIWGYPWFYWGFITFGAEHPYVNKQVLINVGLSLPDVLDRLPKVTT